MRTNWEQIYNLKVSVAYPTSCNARSDFDAMTQVAGVTSMILKWHRFQVAQISSGTDFKWHRFQVTQISSDTDFK